MTNSINTLIWGKSDKTTTASTAKVQTDKQHRYMD